MKKSVLKKEAALQLKTSFQEFKNIKQHEENVEKLMADKNAATQNTNAIVNLLSDVEAS
jgi:hypothetical protein